ncbi:MAG: hypothetical protein WDO15_00365 [Bacteroidota bacterium]
MTEGAYVHGPNDNDWWIPSGRVFYSMGSLDTPATELAEAQSHFFMPRRFRTPFHTQAAPTESLVTYDYDMLVRETTDPLQNKVSGTIDYRVLQPNMVMDANRNRTMVAFDVLGLVAGTAVMGKPEDVVQQGDLLDATFIVDLTESQLSSFEDDPLGNISYTVLGNATSRTVYDLDRFRATRLANPNDPTKWQPT